MSEVALVGYVGDFNGNDDHLVAMDAVAVEAGQHFRYPASGGRRIEVDVDDLGYVHECAPELARRWAAGDVIWFAGRHLVTRSATDVVLRQFAATWTVTPQGHRVRTGSAEELRNWRDDHAHKLSVCLHRYLMDPMEQSIGQAQQTLDFYLAIENTAEPRRFLNTALFYHEQVDFESYNFERERAVRSGAFGTLAEFDDEFDTLKTFLRKDRLAEPPRQVPLRQGFFIRDDDPMGVLNAIFRSKLACEASAHSSQSGYRIFDPSCWHDRDSLLTAGLRQLGRDQIPHRSGNER